MTTPDYAAFYQSCATFRVRLADPEPLNAIERDALTEMLNAFEELMTGSRDLMERVSALDRSLRDCTPPPNPS
jgi:hypothetical protein